jgi:pilus assembly protein CpaE
MAKAASSIDNLHLVLISKDKEFVTATQLALGAEGRSVGFVSMADTIDEAISLPEFETASIIVADLDATQRDQLLSLQRMMVRLQGKNIPVLVLTDTFDESVGRWLLQIRVTDFLRKPVTPSDVLNACVKALKGLAGEDQQARVFSLLPAAGGVGVTSLSIEFAMQIMGSGKLTSGATCLIDLDFQNGACADYLDLEPRFDLNELGTRGERLDQQMLDIMFSRHASGLCVLSAISQAAQIPRIDTPVVLRLLDLVSTRFENVIIDLPRAWAPWTDDILRGSDHVYVVTDMTVPGLRLARRTASSLSQRFENEIKPKVLVNRFEKPSFFGTGLRTADLDRALDGIPFCTVSNAYALVREAIDRGVALSEIKSGNAISSDVKKIIFPKG